MTVLTPANAFPNLAFPQHLSGQTQVTSFTYPGAVWPKATGPAVLSWTNAFPAALTLTTGSTNLARSLNGSSDLINFGSAVNSPQAITLACWANPSSLTPAYSAIFSRINLPGFYQILVKSTGKLALYIADNASGTIDYDGTGSNTLSIGTWYHLALVYSAAGGLIGYVNGASDGTAAGAGHPLHSNTGLLEAGNDTHTAGRVFGGSVADLAQWNVVLTPTQIASLASGARANTIMPNYLDFYVPITGASPEPDFSYHSNSGTLTGTTAVAGPAGLSGIGLDGVFPQHLSGQTNTVQNFLFPGAVQPQVAAATAPKWGKFMGHRGAILLGGMALAYNNPRVTRRRFWEWGESE